ncbi:MAG TPA: hypothetical protein DCO65_02400 [Spartobacteria bacterium]|nr:hypothetical protein [Spartobacteria bacterium]
MFGHVRARSHTANGFNFGQLFFRKPTDSRRCVLEHASMDTEQIEQIEYGRFDDLQRRFGIRRSKAYELIDAGKIKSVAVRKKGSRAGIRLINFNSVREFLRENEAHG